MTCNDIELSRHIHAILRNVGDLERLQRDNKLMELATVLAVMAYSVKHAEFRVNDLLMPIAE